MAHRCAASIPPGELSHWVYITLPTGTATLFAYTRFKINSASRLRIRSLTNRMGAIDEAEGAAGRASQGLRPWNPNKG